MTHPPSPTHHPQLLEVKEWTDNKVPLARMSQDDPLDPPSTKNYQVDGNSNNLGESNMIKEKFIKNPKTFRRVCQSGQVEIKIEYLYPIQGVNQLVNLSF